jgi:excisionase family DNA binding protein
VGPPVGCWKGVGVTAAAGQEHSPVGAAGSQRLPRGPAAGRHQDTRSKNTSGVQAPLTIEAAAERLGVTPRLVRRLVNERRIGFVRIGKFIRLRQEDLDTYIEQHLQPAARTGPRR